jgi:hypothetical protein
LGLPQSVYKLTLQTGNSIYHIPEIGNTFQQYFAPGVFHFHPKIHGDRSTNESDNMLHQIVFL